MKRVLFLAALLLASSRAYATLTTNNMVWEVQPVSGSDGNGGGWDAASTGVDYSTYVRVNIDNSVVTATCAVSGSVLSVIGYPVVAGDVGNVLSVNGGTNVNTGQRFRVTAINTDTKQWTVDRAVCTGGGAGAVIGVFGGPLKSLAVASTTYAAYNKIFIKNEAPMILTSSVTLATSNSLNFTPNARFIGYGTTRGDGVRAVIRMSSNTWTGSPTAINVTAGWIDLENLHVDCNGVVGSSGIINTAGYDTIYNIKVSSCDTAGLYLGGSSAYSLVMNSEFAGMIGNSNGIALRMVNSQNSFVQNYVHDNGARGMYCGITTTCLFNIVANNGSTGIVAAGTSWVYGNVIYKSGGNGMIGGPTIVGAMAKNNIFDQNTLTAIAWTSSAGLPATVNLDGNAFYNAAGTRSNMDDTTTNKINGIAPYTNQSDIILSCDPFVDPDHGDFRLNSKSCGGGALIGHGFPSRWPGLNIAGYPDMGAVQTKPSGVSRARVQRRM